MKKVEYRCFRSMIIESKWLTNNAKSANYTTFSKYGGEPKRASSRPGLYECAHSHCKRQFTVTTKTAIRSTKLPLWKWLLGIYYMINASKGISSVFLSHVIGIKQSSAWKIGHAVRTMMQN